MRRTVLAVTALAGAALLYVTRLREPLLTWGATADEAAAALPGDELVPDAAVQFTRATWIDAPATAVWPWLAQMGTAPRGGFYTYDWIERLLGLEVHSVDRVLPEWQSPQAGDEQRIGANRMLLERVEPGRLLVWRSSDGNWLWSFALREEGGRTRLVSRSRLRLPTLGLRVAMLPLDGMSLVMERRMLQGIRERAERLAAQPVS